jgi:hypothetical protein
MLTFRTTEHHLIVGGKTFYIKDAIKILGGTWSKKSSSWYLPIFLDNEHLREVMQSDAEIAYKAETKKKREEAKASRTYWASPEGQAQLAEEERARVRHALEQKKKTGAYWWICCEECKVIHWEKKHTSCMKCAEWDGHAWNSYRINGAIFIGD